MILCKYSKLGGSIYVPHLDVLREVGRAVRRANLQINFSEGFNPHMLLFFSQPLPLGMRSECEYFCAVSDESPDKFMNGMNAKLPQGLRILAAVRCEDSNVHALTQYAGFRYTSSQHSFTEQGLDSIMSRIEIKIPLKTKKGINETDIRPRIHSLKAVCGAAEAILGCGKENLRGDVFGSYLAQQFKLGDDVDVVKRDAYTVADGKLVSIDEIYGINKGKEKA